MTTKIRNSFRPHDFNEFSLALFIGDLNYTECVECEAGFHPSNTTTVEGWKETQISGLCEKCYDEIFAEELAEESSIDDKIKDMK